jgi:hypothetical protein
MTEFTLDHIKALRNLLLTKSDDELKRMYNCLMRDHAHQIGEADLENASQIYADAFPDDPVPATFGGVARPSRPTSSRPSRQPTRPARPARPSRPPTRPSQPPFRPSAKNIPEEYIIPIIIISCIAVFAVLAYLFGNTVARAATGLTWAENQFIKEARQYSKAWNRIPSWGPVTNITLARLEEHAFGFLNVFSGRPNFDKYFSPIPFDCKKLKYLRWLSNSAWSTSHTLLVRNAEIENWFHDVEMAIFKSWSDPILVAHMPSPGEPEHGLPLIAAEGDAQDESHRLHGYVSEPVDVLVTVWIKLASKHDGWHNDALIAMGKLPPAPLIPIGPVKPEAEDEGNEQKEPTPPLQPSQPHADLEGQQQKTKLLESGNAASQGGITLKFFSTNMGYVLKMERKAKAAGSPNCLFISNAYDILVSMKNAFAEHFDKERRPDLFVRLAIMFGMSRFLARMVARLSKESPQKVSNANLESEPRGQQLSSRRSSLDVPLSRRSSLDAPVSRRTERVHSWGGTEYNL